MAVALLAIGALAGATGFLVTDALERRNDFCNACHLPDGTPLHIAIRQDFDARPPRTLAAAHAAEASPGSGGFRCIDCHGGAGPVERVWVKALAARDALVYVLGHFEEPDGMRFPLSDGLCRSCHPRFDHEAEAVEREAEAAEPEEEAVASGQPFHALPVHNRALGVRCVACHRAHDPGDPALDFLDPATVRPLCADCHPEFGGPW